MRKGIIIACIIFCGIFLIVSHVYAGGRAAASSEKAIGTSPAKETGTSPEKAKVTSPEKVIGTPPEALARTSNITLHRGKGELFYPCLDLASRVAAHTIPAGDEKPGPGWGGPEGHNIGNAPQEPCVIGKYMDRSGRAKDFGFVGDFFRRVGEHLTRKVK